MKKPFTIVCMLMTVMAALAQDVTLSGPGACGSGAATGTWQVPCNITAITVHVYGAGGGAGGGGGGSNGGVFNTRGGGGGGGGAYSSVTIDVVPGTSFTYAIGAGGCGGDNGSDGNRGDDGNDGGGSTFIGTTGGGTALNLLAGGGIKGGGGSGSGNSPGGGGAGGTAAGGTTNDTGVTGTGGSGGNGGAGGNGAGPAGGAGGASTNNPGNTFGGGGAGGGDSDGGDGAAGGIVIYYTDSIGVPTVTSAPATCSAPGSSTISNYNAAYTYSFTPSGPTAGAGGAIGGMIPGDSYTVAVIAGTCTTATSAAFSNAAQLAAPAAPTTTGTAATCDADGSSTISNYNATYTYTFTPSGPTAGAGGAVSGMVVGTSYTVAANDGNCASAESAAFSNAAQLSGSGCDTVTSINDVTNKATLVKVYPNPAVNELTIDYGKAQFGEGDVTLQITNGLGQVVHSQNLFIHSNSQKLAVGNYPSGMYTISIKQNGNMVAQGRLVKE